MPTIARDYRSTLHPLNVLIQVQKNVVQPDNVKPGGGGGGGDELEVEFWKRIKASGIAKADSTSGRFLVILDMRARILTVTSKSAAFPAAAIAEGLVNQMCTFCMQRRSKLFVCRTAANDQAEWIVTDETLASGLLHRLGQLGEFQALQAPPIPPNGIALLRRLLQAVDENTQAMFKVDNARQYRQRVFGVHFNLHSWTGFGAEFLDLIEDPKLQADMALFFDFSRTYSSALHALVSLQEEGIFVSERENDACTAAENLAGSIHHEATQLGMRLLMSNKAHAPKSSLLGNA